MSGRFSMKWIAVVTALLQGASVVAQNSSTCDTCAVAGDTRQDDPHSFFDEWWFYPAVAVGGLLVIMICVMLLLVRRRRKRRRRNRLRSDEFQLEQTDALRRGSSEASSEADSCDPVLEDGMGPSLSTREPEEPFREPTDDVDKLRQGLDAVTELRMAQLETLESMDMDTFGDVRRGRCFVTEGDDDGGIEVLVKSVSGGPGTGATNETLIKLLREVNIMSQFKHRNVVSLVGVVRKGVPSPGHPIAVYAHMVHGPLDRYLRKAKPDLKTQLSMARDVCAGIVYLHSRGFVFGNFSTRVVLVGKDEHVRIGNFGESFSMPDASDPLPKPVLSVMAPELFRDVDVNGHLRWRKSGDSGLAKSLASVDEEPRRKTPAADVWALGIVMWEIFSNAEVAPYHRYPTTKVASLIKGGHRPPAPQGCPRDIYKTMIECWHPGPVKRPNAEVIHRALPQKLPRPSSTASTSFPDLQFKYKANSEDVQREESQDVPADADRAPSPLIHRSLVGLKKDGDSVRDSIVQEGKGTISSRPSNYTSATGSIGSNESADTGGRPRDKDGNRIPRFTSLFDPVKQPPEPSKSEPWTLKKPAIRRDSYLMIMPQDDDGDGIQDVSVEGIASSGSFTHLGERRFDRSGGPKLTRSASEKVTAAHRRDSSRLSGATNVGRRKSALALAMEGIGGSSPPSVELDARSDGIRTVPTTPLPLDRDGELPKWPRRRPSSWKGTTHSSWTTSGVSLGAASLPQTKSPAPSARVKTWARSFESSPSDVLWQLRNRSPSMADRDLREGDRSVASSPNMSVGSEGTMQVKSVVRRMRGSGKTHSTSPKSVNGSESRASSEPTSRDVSPDKDDGQDKGASDASDRDGKQTASPLHSTSPPPGDSDLVKSPRKGAWFRRKKGSGVPPLSSKSSLVGDDVDASAISPVPGTLPESMESAFQLKKPSSSPGGKSARNVASGELLRPEPSSRSNFRKSPTESGGTSSSVSSSPFALTPSATARMRDRQRTSHSSLDGTRPPSAEPGYLP